MDSNLPLDTRSGKSNDRLDAEAFRSLHNDEKKVS